MDFPITVESQNDFDTLVRARLDREKGKLTDLEQQVATLTTEKQALETAAAEATTRAEAAEQWKADREAADAANELRSTIANEYGINAAALRGADEAELRAHAEILKPLIQQPVAPVVPNAGDSPNRDNETSPEREFLREIGLGDE